MKLRTTAAVALVSVAMTMGGAFTALAQGPGSPGDQPVQKLRPGVEMRGELRGHKMDAPRMRDGARGGQLLALACRPNAADRLEGRFASLSERLTLTPEQKPHFDALEAAVLTAQTRFADACTAARPQADAGQRPDLVERMHMRLKLDQARVAALTEVLPTFETFYGSLSDEQKAMFERGDRRGMGKRDGGGDRWHDRHDRQERRGFRG